MREVYDNNTGAILFKSEDESNPTDKRISILENKLFQMNTRMNALENKLNALIEKDSP